MGVGAPSPTHSTGGKHLNSTHFLMGESLPILGTQLIYLILMVRDPILPGPKAFGRGPGKIRASDQIKKLNNKIKPINQNK